jgi:hypothetical protein
LEAERGDVGRQQGLGVVRVPPGQVHHQGVPLVLAGVGLAEEFLRLVEVQLSHAASNSASSAGDGAGGSAVSSSPPRFARRR